MTARRGKRVPQRTCVGCRRTAPQQAFVRVVRTAERMVLVDQEKRTAGRGAYLCPKAACWERALKGRRLANALRTTLSNVEQERLRRIGANFPAPETGQGDDD